MRTFLKRIIELWPIITAIFILGATVSATIHKIEEVEARARGNSRVIISVKDDLGLIRESQIRTEENIKFIYLKLEDNK